MASLGDDLLRVVNQLQDLVFNTIGSDSLDLPQIVVVGSQSAGKSSVLENIVGRDFLPRGSGIVTRRPLILQLINVDEDESEPDTNAAYRNASAARRSEWAEFHHIPGRRFTDFGDVKREIESETSRVAGNNKGINRQPINLKVYSPYVLNLTLVDLPGLTKVPIGDQPADIEKQTRTLISEFIAKPNSIILAVSPANVDIVNSEALKLARHVDPLGRRTVGVLTKVDLMDHGTNALDILSGRVYPLKLGFIGVVNRSQHDIQGNKPMEEALKAENEFFRHHPAYRNIATRCGTHSLAKTLNQTLMSHIRERLPDIKARLNTLMGQTQQELASYGDMHFSGKEHRGSMILQLMTKFASGFISSIDGTSTEISTKELSGGARIYYIFNSVFGSALETIDPTSNLSALDIRTAIRNSTGPRPSLFVPEMAFDLLVKPQIKLLEIPSQRCVELICSGKDWAPASSYVESLISIQRAYINTNHPNFLGAAAAMSHVVSNKQDKERKRLIQEERERRERRRMKELGEANGAETPDDNEDAATEKGEAGPARKQIAKGSRSMSPAVRENGTGSLSAAVNGRSASPSRPGPGGARDTFLTYFFGKDGASPPGGAGAPSSLPRHVSQSVEPSFSQSIRSREEKHRPALSSSLIREPETPITGEFGSVTPFSENTEPALTDREAMETELIRALISSYFNIVRESIADQVPKAVMHLLVNHSKDVVQNRLVSELYKEALFEELLYEDDAVKKGARKVRKATPDLPRSRQDHW
ncbi:Dynamin central region [Apiospora aurea]|uniref:Dynamin central region n=1 Tax=Apiospora aurea TaxID=335848 RepID=A0ABR1QD26_9PEZI